MALNFPTNPTIGQEFTGGGKTWAWTGAAWESVDKSSTKAAKEQIFKTSGTFIKPAGVNKITVTACGGGAGYPNSTNFAYGPNGAFIECEYDISSKPDGASIPIVIGAGGGATAGGGMTSVDSKIYAPGGFVPGASANQPDAGVLSPSGDGYLKTQVYVSNAGGTYNGGTANFYHQGYKLRIPTFYHSTDKFNTIYTTKPDGTVNTFTPDTTNPIYYYAWSASQGNENTPNIATDGNGTIIVTGFYRSSSHTSEKRFATIVTTDHGATWNLLDQSALATLLTGSTADIQINYAFINNLWVAYLFKPSSRETGSIMATSTNLSAWSAVGSGVFNAAAVNNDGGVPYGGNAIFGVYYDSSSSIWYVARWSRNGYYQNRIYIHKSSSADLVSSTWTKMFHSQNENGGDYLQYYRYVNNSNATIAKLADNTTYRFSFPMYFSNSWYVWEMEWNSSSTAPSVVRTQTANLGSGPNGTAYSCGFSKKLNAFVYFYSYASTSYATEFTYVNSSGNRASAGIYTEPGSDSYRYYYQSIGSSVDDAEKDHYITPSNNSIMIELRKAVMSFGSKHAPTGTVGVGGYNGLVKRTGAGTGASVYLEPTPHPDKFTPAQYSDTAGIWFMYDSSWPGAGGYYLTSQTNDWVTRNGNNGQVIIRWTV